MAELINAGSSWLIFSHTRPDADAYGSSCGLKLILESLNKNVECINESGALSRYFAIPGTDTVVSEVPSGKWDGIIVCDCGAAKRVGDSLVNSLNNTPILINIDHHVSNDMFGTHNLVVNTASSTSEIIYFLAKELNVPITKEIATCLFAGIAGDTGSFKYQSTSPNTFLIAHELVEKGASPYQIHQALYGNQSLAATRLQADALNRMEILADGAIAEVVVPTSSFDRFKAEVEDADVLVDMARDIENIRVATLLRQDGEIWRVSLRSKTDKDNVAVIAEKFGGGGHKAAAGFRWKRDLETLKNQLRETIIKSLGI